MIPGLGWLYLQTRRGRHRKDKADERRTFGDLDYDHAEFACPYDGEPLVAPWQHCPACGRND